MKQVKVNKQTLEIFENAVTANKEAAQGIVNIRNVIKLFDKIEECKNSEKEFISIDEKDINLIKESMEKVQWVPMKAVLIKVDEAFKALDEALKCDESEKN